MLIKPPSSDPLCRGCQHFGVSYDRDLPYVCRAMGFKSKTMPIWEVRSVVVHGCLAYQPRKPKQAKSPNARGSRVNVKV